MIDTATGADIEYLKSLGIEQILDYKSERFEDTVSGVDAVVDLVGGETLSRSYSVVKKGGVLATTVQPINELAAKRAGIRAVQVIMRRNAADLAELARLVEKGAIKPRLGETMSLTQQEKRRNSARTAKRAGR